MSTRSLPDQGVGPEERPDKLGDCVSFVLEYQMAGDKSRTDPVEKVRAAIELQTQIQKEQLNVNKQIAEAVKGGLIQVGGPL